MRGNINDITLGDAAGGNYCCNLQRNSAWSVGVDECYAEFLRMQNETDFYSTEVHVR